MNMDFSTNKTPVEVIKEGRWWYRKSWKESEELGDIDQKYYCSS